MDILCKAETKTLLDSLYETIIIFLNVEADWAASTRTMIYYSFRKTIVQQSGLYHTVRPFMYW